MESKKIFISAATNGKIANKDRVANNLVSLRRLYKMLGVTGSCVNRIVGMLENEFYNADRVGQCKTADRIHTTVQRLSRASSMFERPE